MKKIKLTDVNKLNVSSEDKERIQKKRESMVLETIIEKLSTVIKNNTAVTSEVSNMVKQDKSILSKLVSTIEQNKPIMPKPVDVQKVEVMNQTKSKEWMFTIQRDSQGFIKEVIAKEKI